MITISDRRYELERFLKIDCNQYPDSQILLMHEMQCVLRDNSTSARMKSMATFVFRLAADGNSEWLDKLTDEMDKEKADYGAFDDSNRLLNDWWSDAAEKYESDND